ncbi:CopD family protein [Candidatus Parabeggiatoa sp. HSG14]|uniref:CopD family protein n=1 Tax=Candidatus Parabeggiatoa sp. HSG14 TaxID=3055593 RepID=UPI0025A6F3F5|nr:CopD family protein [Thiotrichales bacterium HSG14]
MSFLQTFTTNYAIAIAITLHVLSTVVWVGGMFFAHTALRPAATHLLEPPLRLPLMSQIFSRFFPAVWVAIILLWVTGLWVIFSYGGMSNIKMHIHIMLGLATLMTVLFIYIFFVPYPGIKQAIAQKNFKQAGKNLVSIRQLIYTNLWLGIITIIVGTAGRYM